MTKAGYSKNASFGCSACCAGKHLEEEGCDMCPYMDAGYEAMLILKLFRLSTENHQDTKTKIKKTYLNLERLQFAFDLLDISDKERAYQFLGQGINIINGEM